MYVQETVMIDEKQRCLGTRLDGLGRLGMTRYGDCSQSIETLPQKVGGASLWMQS